jgi:hypothetical protein
MAFDELLLPMGISTLSTRTRPDLHFMLHVFVAKSIELTKLADVDICYMGSMPTVLLIRCPNKCSWQPD